MSSYDKEKFQELWHKTYDDLCGALEYSPEKLKECDCATCKEEDCECSCHEEPEYRSWAEVKTAVKEALEKNRDVPSYDLDQQTDKMVRALRRKFPTVFRSTGKKKPAPVELAEMPSPTGFSEFVVLPDYPEYAANKDGQVMNIAEGRGRERGRLLRIIDQRFFDRKVGKYKHFVGYRLRSGGKPVSLAFNKVLKLVRTVCADRSKTALQLKQSKGLGILVSTSSESSHSGASIN